MQFIANVIPSPVPTNDSDSPQILTDIFQNRWKSENFFENITSFAISKEYCSLFSTKQTHLSFTCLEPVSSFVLFFFAWNIANYKELNINKKILISIKFWVLILSAKLMLFLLYNVFHVLEIALSLEQAIQWAKGMRE